MISTYGFLVKIMDYEGNSIYLKCKNILTYISLTFLYFSSKSPYTICKHNYKTDYLHLLFVKSLEKNNYLIK